MEDRPSEAISVALAVRAVGVEELDARICERALDQQRHKCVASQPVLRHDERPGSLGHRADERLGETRALFEWHGAADSRILEGAGQLKPLVLDEHCDRLALGRKAIPGVGLIDRRDPSIGDAALRIALRKRHYASCWCR